MPDQSGRLTEQERSFIEHMIASADPVYSAEKAGYAHPRPSASKLVRRPEVVAAIREAVLVRLYSEGVPVAVNTLLEIARDEKAPKNPRIAAARTLAEMTRMGVIDGNGLDKPLSEMTRAELSAAKDRALAYLAELDAPVIEGQAIALPAPEPEGLFD